MKQVDKCVVGNFVSVDSYTSEWDSIKLNPGVFYRRYAEFSEGFKKIKGLYAELDMGESIVIRFSDRSDMTLFYRLHHEYV